MKPSPPPPRGASPRRCLIVDQPPEASAELAALAQLAGLDGHELLAGADPDATGLLIVHPRSPACPPGIARQGAAAVRVAPLPELRTLAHLLGAPLAAPPGTFAVLLVGSDQAAAVHLIPTPARQSA